MLIRKTVWVATGVLACGAPVALSQSQLPDSFTWASACSSAGTASFSEADARKVISMWRREAGSILDDAQVQRVVMRSIDALYGEEAIDGHRLVGLAPRIDSANYLSYWNLLVAAAESLPQDHEGRPTVLFVVNSIKAPDPSTMVGTAVEEQAAAHYSRLATIMGALQDLRGRAAAEVVEMLRLEDGLVEREALGRVIRSRAVELREGEVAEIVKIWMRESGLLGLETVGKRSRVVPWTRDLASTIFACKNLVGNKYTTIEADVLTDLAWSRMAADRRVGLAHMVKVGDLHAAMSACRGDSGVHGADEEIWRQWLARVRADNSRTAFRMIEVSLVPHGILSAHMVATAMR